MSRERNFVYTFFLALYFFVLFTKRYIVRCPFSQSVIFLHSLARIYEQIKKKNKKLILAKNTILEKSPTCNYCNTFYTLREREKKLSPFSPKHEFQCCSTVKKTLLFEEVTIYERIENEIIN